MKKIDEKRFHRKVVNCFSEQYQITDAAIKHFTLLYGFRTKNYPRRLKIEVRKQPKRFRYEEAIAFSPHSTRQVMLKAPTLEQMMENKIKAALGRREIRDCFDLEFLFRKGIKVDVSNKMRKELKEKIACFKKKDFTVTLESLLNPPDWNYYAKNGFKFLISKL